MLAVTTDLENTGNNQSMWVEENATSMTPIMSFSMENAVAELHVSSCLATQTRTILSFRFKDFAHPMKLCRRGGKFYITFALKYPPRLTSVSTDLSTDWETRRRVTTIEDGSVAFGFCLGYCLQISNVEVRALLSAKAFNKLKRFGLFDCEDGLDLPRDAELICKEQVCASGRLKLDAKLASLCNTVSLWVARSLHNQ